MGKNLTPLTLESAMEGYKKFLKVNKLKENETPKDSELAAKKAGWETKIAKLNTDAAEGNKGSKKKKGKEDKKGKKSSEPRKSEKYNYPSDCTSAEDRKKFRSKARAAAKAKDKPAKASKKSKTEDAPVKKKKKASKKSTED